MAHEVKEDVKFPICPMGLYFEGDEVKIKLDACDYNVEFRECSEACKHAKELEQEKFYIKRGVCFHL